MHLLDENFRLKLKFCLTHVFVLGSVLASTERYIFIYKIFIDIDILQKTVVY